MNENFITEKIMENAVLKYKLFVDTCSLLEPQAEKAINTLVPILVKHNKKIIVPHRVIEEINKHQSNIQNTNLATSAKKAIKILESLGGKNCIEVRGEDTDNFADNVFITVFSKFRIQHNLMLITQDRELATDLLNLNHQKSVYGKRIRICRIVRDGYFEEIVDSNNLRTKIQPGNRTKKAPQEIEKFEIVTNVNVDDNEKIQAAEIPGVNSKVFNSKKETIILLKELAAGGEGKVYLTSASEVAKIYSAERLTKAKFEKIKLMISKKIEYAGICWPLDILTNCNGDFVGYLMPMASGKEMQKCLFVKPLLINNFPNWTKQDTIKLCITVLQKICYLHMRNIILGDINPMNILIKSSEEVYFVDTDSYQIEGYPCPVGTINFTAPEIQRKSFDTFLRTIGNENFAIATLMFMIMLPGKPPYSQQGGENPVENIIKMDFSYPFGENRNYKVPAGPWRYCWSHLPRNMKEIFYETFKKGGKYSDEGTRRTVRNWITDFQNYQRVLNVRMIKDDPMSSELFPVRVKKGSEQVLKKCHKCNKEFPSDEKHLICNECAGIERNKRNNIVMRIQCTDCGNAFSMSEADIEFYQSKGFDTPKRCKICRGAKKVRPPITYIPPYAPSVPKKPKKSDGWCFITTAVCEHQMKPDNCYELKMFRWFRDSWLAKQEGGGVEIAKYYRIAPTIVREIDKLSDKKDIYFSLWSDYLSTCLKYIENAKYAECASIYRKMVLELASTYYKGENEKHV